MNWKTGSSGKMITARHNDTEYVVVFMNQKWSLFSRHAGLPGTLYPLKSNCETSKEAIQFAEDIIKF